MVEFLKFRLTNGCGNAFVVVQGMVNIRCNGIPNTCAQCKCAKLGGFAMMASATNGRAEMGSGSIQELQKPFSISPTIFLFSFTSPAFRLCILGINPGFLTM